jgi:UDP-2-acetamido-2,6-beta-L-arabino-hexul-4-ose reductase
VKVLITGAAGFTGKNLISQLRLLAEPHEILTYTKETTESIESLLDQADFVFHLAGVNRPKDEKEFKEGNTDLTGTIVSHLTKTGKKTPLLISSSIQAELDNPYGKSKLAAEELVQGYSKATGADCYIARLPNIFGKWSRPNYNSAVATFCYNLTHSLPVTINDASAPLNLIYIDDVVSIFIDCLNGNTTPDGIADAIKSRTLATTVGHVADTLEQLVAVRKTLVVPDLSDKLTKYLYSTLTSFYDEQDLTTDLVVNSDDRGWLFELAKSHQFGQIFISQTKPGFVRGEHWHHTKVERFCVIQGQGEVFFRALDSDRVFSHKLTGDKVQIIDIPVGVIHAIENTGTDDMLLVIWANEILDKDNPDTYWEKVRQ